MQVIRLLPALFIFSGFILATDHFIQSKLQSMRGARKELVTALGSSRARLVNGLWQIIGDSSVSQGIATQNVNQLTQALQSYLRPGEVTQVEILDQSCGVVVRATSTQKPIQSGCKSEFANGASLKWQKSQDELPVLSFVLPKQVGEKLYFIVGHLALDQAWLSGHPFLFSRISSNQFNLFDDSVHGRIWEDGISSSGDALVTLRLGGWVSRFLPNLINYSLEIPEYPVWWVFVVLGSAIAGLVLQRGFEEKRGQIARQNVTAWLAKYMELGQNSDSSIESAGRNWETLTSAIQAKVDRIFEQKQMQWKMMRDRQDQMTLGAVQRDRQISELQERLAAMSDLASLKEQLQHSTGSFLKKMKDVRELCEDMFDVTSDGLAPQGKELQSFVNRWKAGINDVSHRERGARKFLRSLSETAGSKPGTTKLDDELEMLGDITSITMDQALHLAMLSRQALTELESGVQVAGLWLGLSSRENNRERTTDWMESLIAAQQLVGAETRYSSLTFEKLPQFGSPEETYPPVARVALVSGLFHLYMALLADVTIEAVKLPIVLRQKRFADKGTLIFSLPQAAQDIADSGTGRGQAYHMDLAKAILAPLGVRAAFLPPTIAGVPVAITWTLPTKDVDVSPAATVEVHAE